MADLGRRPLLSLPLVRRVPWDQIPLGAVVLDWPKIYGAGIPELAGYPLVTRNLRETLTAKYQLGPRAQVLILDPDSSVDSQKILQEDQAVQRLTAALPPLHRLKDQLRRSWKNHPDFKSGLAQQLALEGSPFQLKKNWSRSVKSLALDQGGFADQLWGRRLTEDSLGEILGRVISQELKVRPSGPSLVDVGVDVSFSMENGGKASWALEILNQILPLLALKLGFSTWRLWLVGEGVRALDWTSLPGSGPLDLDKILKAHRMTPGETRFRPFFQKVLNRDPGFSHHLCLLFTDGVCQDRDEALRVLEKFHQAPVDYFQTVFHRQEDFLTGICTPFSDRTLDGVLKTEDLKPGETRFTRTPEELKEFTQTRLREVTDLAEVALGAQQILTWMPLTASLTLDVYEQYMIQELLN